MLLRPRHFRRYREIAEVLADHGFGAILVQLGIRERLNTGRGAIAAPAPAPGIGRPWNNLRQGGPNPQHSLRPITPTISG